MPIHELTPAEALPRLGEFTVIDVREPDEYVGELGHVDGAALSPLGGVPAAAAGWDKSKNYLVICRSGGRSGRAAMVLSQMGFPNVTNMTGGMLAWNAAGLPVVR